MTGGPTMNDTTAVTRNESALSTNAAAREQPERRADVALMPPVDVI